MLNKPGMVWGGGRGAFVQRSGFGNGVEGSGYAFYSISAIPKVKLTPKLGSG